MEVVERVRQLIEVMADHDLAEIEVEEPDLRIKITKKQPPQTLAAPPYGYQLQMPQAPGYQPQLQPGQAPDESEEAMGRQRDLLEITSPMVGTFYRSPSSGAEPYVGVGDRVEPETVVCIIEAMKVMNEIKAEVDGVIAEMLVEDAEPIEYGQVLFLAEPAAD